MYTLIFTRLTGDNEEAIFWMGDFGSLAEAQQAMRDEVNDFIENKDFERRWCMISDHQAFLGSETMYDTCRFYIFDKEYCTGYQNDRNIDYQIMTGQLD